MVVTAENQPAAPSANTRKRAQISANERKLKMCAFQNSRAVQEPDEDPPNAISPGHTFRT